MAMAHALVRAPSTVSLLCASCGRLVTPCLVCACLLPCCGSVAWQVCRKCRVKNPLGDPERRLLGFPPALALPPPMVRRVLVAHLGRSACVLAAHVQYLRTQKELAEGLTGDALDTNAAKEPSCHESSKSQCVSDFLRIPLPFLQCDGMVNSAPSHNHAPVLYRQSCARKTHEIENDMVRDVPHLEQIPVTDTLAGNCHDCGCESQGFCSEQSLFNETGLMRCEEELLALHCAEALSTDLNCSSYPVCTSVVSSNFITVGTETCNVKLSNSCASRTVGCVSFGILRLVSSLLAPGFEAWLIDRGTGNCESTQHMEDILATTEQFLQNRETLLQLKRSMFKAQAAQKQAAKDYRAVLRRQSSEPTEVCYLKQIFADRVQGRTQKFMRVAEPYLALLNQINLILEFCYAEACTASVSQFPTFLCTATPEQSVKAIDKIERYKFSEAVRTTVSSWLLLYHDVAHGTGLI